MTDEDKRSCFTCELRPLCALKRAIRDVLLSEMPYLKGALRPHTDIFDTLAEACNQYTRQEEKA